MTPDELPTTDNKPNAGAQQADRQREEAAQKMSLWGKIKNFFGNLFRRREVAAPEAKEEVKPPHVKEITAFLSAWDDLTDDSDALKQKFDNTLADLVKSEPSELQGSKADDPKAVEAYRQSLVEYQDKITAAEASYGNAVTELQQRRDALLSQEVAKDRDIDKTALDAPLGAAGEGPGHKWFQTLKNETQEAIDDLDAKPEQLAPPPEEIVLDTPDSMLKNEDVGFIRSEQERKKVVSEVGTLLKESVEKEQETGALSLDMEQVHAITAKLSNPDNISEFSVKDQLHAGRNSATMAAIYESISDLQDGRNNVSGVVEYAGGSFTKSPTTEMVNRHSEKGEMKDPEGFKEDLDSEKAHIAKVIAKIEKENAPSTPEHSTPSMGM
jgi:hypothetical protein